MATTADNIVGTSNAEAGKMDFLADALKAPFLLRVAAFCLDYMILIALPVFWLLASKLFGDPGAHGISSFIWVIAAILLVVDLLLFPLLRGQTIGKMVTGLTIVNTDGSDVRLAGIIKRNVIGYFITAATFGLGFLLAGINSSGRALHDIIGGTTVVRGRRKEL